MNRYISCIVVSLDGESKRTENIYKENLWHRYKELRMRVYLNNSVPLLLLLKNSQCSHQRNYGELVFPCNPSIKSTINGLFRFFQMKKLPISISQLLLLVMLEKRKTWFSSGHYEQITFFDKY
ncbi:hypothetical protein AMTRI_Chr13g82430 [Amborella trichopoda]